MMDEDLCLGAFGFRVYSDRTLVAGPPSGGGVVSGIIRGRELEILDRDVAGITPTDLNAPLVCRSDRVIPGVDDKVILSNGQRHFVVYEENSVALRGSDCASGDPVKAEKLHADLSAMMREYYPVPFPLGVVARPGSP